MYYHGSVDGGLLSKILSAFFSTTCESRTIVFHFNFIYYDLFIGVNYSFYSCVIYI